MCPDCPFVRFGVFLNAVRAISDTVLAVWFPALYNVGISLQSDGYFLSAPVYFVFGLLAEVMNNWKIPRQVRS